MVSVSMIIIVMNYYRFSIINLYHSKIVIIFRYKSLIIINNIISYKLKQKKSKRLLYMHVEQ